MGFALTRISQAQLIDAHKQKSEEQRNKARRCQDKKHRKGKAEKARIPT
jgi:hypothetical protein